MLWGVEIVESLRLRRPFPRALGKAAAITAACLRAGLVVYPSTGCANGTDGDAVLLAPPFVATEAQLQEMVDILDHVLFGLDL